MPPCSLDLHRHEEDTRSSYMLPAGLTSGTKLCSTAVSYLTSRACTFWARQVALKEGPVHCATWAPDGSAFAVVAGFMPAQTVIFDAKCSPPPTTFPRGPPAPVGALCMHGARLLKSTDRAEVHVCPMHTHTPTAMSMCMHDGNRAPITKC